MQHRALTKTYYLVFILMSLVTFKRGWLHRNHFYITQQCKIQLVLNFDFHASKIVFLLIPQVVWCMKRAPLLLLSCQICLYCWLNPCCPGMYKMVDLIKTTINWKKYDGIFLDPINWMYLYSYFVLSDILEWFSKYCSNLGIHYSYLKRQEDLILFRQFLLMLTFATHMSSDISPV